MRQIERFRGNYGCELRKFRNYCRVNAAYGRYYDGLTQLQVLASRLTGLVVQALAFDGKSLVEDASLIALQAHERFKDNLMHLVSLLHAVALATLRQDFNMDNITVSPHISVAIMLPLPAYTLQPRFVPL
jgi:hypothetical protein